MDDIIFEKDYRETESAEYDKWCDEVFDRAVNCGMLKAYSEAMDKIPKIIVPEDKKNYEYLLERCDAFVKQHRGISRESWTIIVGTRKSICFFRLRSSMTQKTLHF